VNWRLLLRELAAAAAVAIAIGAVAFLLFLL